MAKHKYISQDAAIDAVDVCNLHRGIIDALQAIISDIPTADVRPVKRGRWINAYPKIEPNPMYMYGICSECGFEQSISNKLNYCPHCGADMREVESNG